MSLLFDKMELLDVKGKIDCYRNEIKGNVKNYYLWDFNNEEMVLIGTKEEVEDALINLFIEANGVSDEVACYLDEEKIIRDLTEYGNDYDLAHLDNLEVLEAQLSSVGSVNLLKCLKEEAEK